jgi:hypothetical protein
MFFNTIDIRRRKTVQGAKTLRANPASILH